MATEEIVTVGGIPLPLRKTRKQIVIATLAFCWSVVAMLLWKGEPTNSLHTSALAWAFATSTAVIFAYVFGAVVDNINLYKASQK